jgi:hypothetical protein
MICYVIFREHIKPFITQIDKEFSSLEINIIAGLILLIVPAFVFVLGFVLNLLIYRFHLPKKLLSESLIKASHLLLKAEPKWGLTLYSQKAKNLNISEALFFPIFFKDKVTPASEDVFKKAAYKLMDNIEDSGLLSISYGQFTVQCTSLGLFVLSKIMGNNFIRFNQSQLEKIDKLYESLLTSNSDHGWGTLTKQITNSSETRFTTSFWALRALNSYAEKLPEKVKDTLFSLINLQPDGKFGFHCGDNPKISSVSLFLILLSEIKDSEINLKIAKSISIKDLLEYPKKILWSDLSVEIEDYKTSNIPDLKVEKLPFTHVAPLYALSALFCYKNQLSLRERIRLRKIFNDTLIDFLSDDRSGLRLPGLTQSSDNPLVFPICYLIETLFQYRRAYGIK